MFGKSNETLNFDGEELAVKKTPDGREIEYNALTTLGNFIKHEMDVPFTFCCDPGIGDAYVKRMRSELSRLRNKARMMKRRPKRFKVMLVGIEQFETHDEVTLKMTLNATQQITNELRQILSAMSEE